MKKICVFLAEGFEEIEALTVVDLARRAEIEVTTVSIGENKEVTGSHNITVLADAQFEEIKILEYDMLVLPGGMPGTLHLGEHEALVELLKKQNQDKKWVAAICAAPSILGKNQLLNGERATSYPTFEETLEGATVLQEKVVESNRFITSRGMGTSIDFSLKIIEVLVGENMSNKIAKSILFEKI